MQKTFRPLGPLKNFLKGPGPFLKKDHEGYTQMYTYCIQSIFDPF